MGVNSDTSYLFTKVHNKTATAIFAVLIFSTIPGVRRLFLGVSKFEYPLCAPRTHEKHQIKGNRVHVHEN